MSNLADAPAPGIRLSRAILIVLFAFYVAVAVSQRVPLFADGAYQFLYALLKEEFSILVYDGSGRGIASGLARVPVWIAIRLGLTDFGALQLVFGAGLFLHFALMLWICAKAAGERRELLLFPLASFFLLSANIVFFAWTPSHLMVSVFWSQLYVLLLPKRWSARWFATSLLLAYVSLSSYESMVVLGVILALAAAWRAWAETSPLLRVGAVAVAVLSLTGVVTAYRTLQERGVDHYTEDPLPFFDGGSGLHGSALISLVAIALIATVASRHRRIWLLGVVTLGIACAAWIAVSALRPEIFSVELHHQARTLNLSFTLVLFVLFVAALFRERSQQAWRKAWFVLAVAGVMQTAWLVVGGSYWQAYLRLFASELSVTTGLRRLEETRLRNQIVDGRPVLAFAWSWVYPLMSILESPGGNVRSMITNGDWFEGKQPLFDPRDPAGLPALERFGVRYDEYRSALRSSPPDSAARKEPPP